MIETGISYGPGRAACLLDVYVPDGAAGTPVVVWFHGGGLREGERTIPAELIDQGLAVVSADYRMYPAAKAPDFIEDAAAAAVWTFRNIARYGGDPRKVVVAGASAGAYLAAMIGLDRSWLAAHDIDANVFAGLGLITGQAVTHFAVREARGLPGHCAVVDELAPLYHIRADVPPILLVTGDRDLELLGRYEENAYFARMLAVAGHRDHELHELKGCDHGGVEAGAHPLLLAFVRRVCGRST